MIAGKSDDALDEMLFRIHRVTENHYVSPVNDGVRKNGLPETARAEAGLIHQQIITDEQGVFHRTGGDAESLDDKGDDEQGDSERQQGELEMFHHMKWCVLAMLVRAGRGGRSRRLRGL